MLRSVLYYIQKETKGVTTMTSNEMKAFYNKISGAHKYIVGFVRKGIVYYVTVNFAELCELMRDDRASSKRGGYAKIRIMVRAEQANTFIATGRAVALCEVDELVADKGHNKGENFERIITETLTSELWVKDSVPFWVKGDINVNGEEIQIKLNGAELTNEKTLMKYQAEVA